MKAWNKALILNFVSSTLLYLFYFCGVLAALLCIMPWSEVWSLIEVPLLFAPRWWMFLLLVLTIIINISQVKAQWKAVLTTSLVIAFCYLDFKIPVNKLFSDQAGQSLPIMSVNLGGGVKDPSLLKNIIVDEQLVLIAFQETPGREVKKIVPEGWDRHCLGQMCLASAYKLTYINSQSRRILGGWGHLGSLYQLSINGQLVYVMNIHLETPRKGIEDFQLSKLNFNALFKNSDQRYLESNLISGWVIDKKPIIIMGDFNMTVKSSIYRKNYSHYRNAFNEAGLGFGYTKHTRILSTRIDHILFSDDINIINAKVGDDIGSDHSPLIATLVF
jgi:hypothetical protein